MSVLVAAGVLLLVIYYFAGGGKTEAAPVEVVAPADDQLKSHVAHAASHSSRSKLR
jgi:hypothetical protein